jgi:small subunit ribosomal protein S18
LFVCFLPSIGFDHQKSNSLILNRSPLDGHDTKNTGTSTLRRPYDGAFDCAAPNVVVLSVPFYLPVNCISSLEILLVGNMAYRRLLVSNGLLSRLSSMSLRPAPVASRWQHSPLDPPRWRHNFRVFSNKGGSGRDNDDKFVGEELEKPTISEDEDFFGVNFEDGADNIGPERSFPPKYKRDATTGRLTGEVEAEVTEEERNILKADPLERERRMISRLESHWQEEGADETGLPTELSKLGRRVRQAEMGLNVVGRSVQAQASKEELEDGTELGRKDDGFSQKITPDEFESFAEYMKKEHKIELSQEDIPSMDRMVKSEHKENADDRSLSMKWLSSRAQREMDDFMDDNPYSDLMPGDLSPTRLVNRKRAKQIPVKLLHHNNIPLLKSFLTPTGQIRNRVQTRLGARDQRRVTKLIKRARCLGLMPFSGQFKAEHHGWKHAEDIHKMRPWEKELIRRGLVVQRGAKDKN